MTLSKSYERAVRSYLTEGYGATVLSLDGGGKHRRLRFEYRGKPYVLTLATSPNHDELSAIKMKRRDVRHLLGPPLLRSTPKEKRSMDNMMPDYLSDTPPTMTAESLSCDGSMAYYSQKRLRFYVSAPFADAIPQGPYSVSRSSRDMWELTPDPKARPRLVRNSGNLWSLDWKVQDLDLGPFGATPAKYVLVDGHVLVHLDVSDLRPIKPPQSRAVAALRAPEPPAEQSGTAATPSGNPHSDDLRAILADIRRIEATTDRRLVRVQASDGKDARWAWKADLID